MSITIDFFRRGALWSPAFLCMGFRPELPEPYKSLAFREK